MRHVKKTILLGVLVLVLGFMFVSQGEVQAFPCTTTISTALQVAIDAASDGDTICVLPGTYAESIIFASGFTTDNLTIAGKKPNDRPNITGGVRFLNTTDIDFLEMRNLHFTGDVGGGAVIDMDNTGDVNHLRLHNNWIDGEDLGLTCDSDGFGVGRHGILGQNLGGNLTVTNNDFRNILGWSVFDRESGGVPTTKLDIVTFSDNYVVDSNGSVSIRGVPGSRTDEVHVVGNRWDNIGNNNSCTGMNWAAIEVNQAETVHINNNWVNDVEKGCFDPPTCSAAEGQGFQVWAIDTLDISGNHLTDIEQYGIWVAAVTGFTDIPASHVSFNNIDTGGEFGIFVGAPLAWTGAPVMGECNFWGAKSGPIHATLNPGGTGDIVSDDVDFIPFRKSEFKGGGKAPKGC